MKKILKAVMWLVIAAIIIGTFSFLYKNSRPKVDSYDLVSPSVNDVLRSTVLNGKIEPRDEIEIKPQINGIISELCVEAGDFVHKDDVIAKIKVIPEETQLNSAQNRVEVAQLALDQAKWEYDRSKQLYDKKFISREEYEKSYIAFKQAEQELEAAADALSIVRDGVSSLNAQSSNTLVRSTIDGQILEIPVKVGSSVIQANTMNDGTTVAKIADMGNLIFKGKVDETEVGLLRQGMTTDISIGALPDVKYVASIEYIAPKSTEENGSNTFEVKAALSLNDSTQLRAGYSANAAVVLQRESHTLTVPESCIEWVGDSTFVYVLTSDNPQTFTRTPVVTGISDGVNIAVKQGIDSDVKLRGNKLEEKK